MNAKELDDILEELWKWRLTLPEEVYSTTGGIRKQKINDNDTLREIARVVCEAQEMPELEEADDEVEVRGIVMAEDEDPSPTAAKLREELLAEFEGTVFRDRVWPDPPERGTHGKAKLHLKPGAVPPVGRVINLKGESLEAMGSNSRESSSQTKSWGQAVDHGRCSRSPSARRTMRGDVCATTP